MNQRDFTAKDCISRSSFFTRKIAACVQQFVFLCLNFIDAFLHPSRLLWADLSNTEVHLLHSVQLKFYHHDTVSNLTEKPRLPPPFWAEQITEVYVCFVFCSIKYTESRLPCFTAERGHILPQKGP